MCNFHKVEGTWLIDDDPDACLHALVVIIQLYAVSICHLYNLYGQFFASFLFLFVCAHMHVCFCMCMFARKHVHVLIISTEIFRKLFALYESYISCVHKTTNLCVTDALFAEK